MNSLQKTILQEIETLPLYLQNEVLDFVLYLKSKADRENDTDYLSSNPKIKQAIIDGLNTPLGECSELDME